MDRTGWEPAALVICMVLAWAPPGYAQAPASVLPSSVPPLRLAALPVVPELRLRWPLSPLEFSFTGAEVDALALVPLPLYRAESLWLSTPALQLVTVGRAERALELDCRLTCQPVLQHAVDLEVRLPMPALLPSAASAHAYVRSSSYYTSQSPRSVRLLSAGLAGVF